MVTMDRVHESAVTAIDGHTQERGVATAMTRGVSVAIWMGRVARDLTCFNASNRHENLRAPPCLLAMPQIIVKDRLT
jgi:hypothetical protein